jgi:co-chaperonin GroES (HSP10)
VEGVVARQTESLFLLFDSVLVERSAAKIVRKKKGIMMPEKSKTEILQATVVNCWIRL